MDQTFPQQQPPVGTPAGFVNPTAQQQGGSVVPETYPMPYPQPGMPAQPYPGQPYPQYYAGAQGYYAYPTQPMQPQPQAQPQPYYGYQSMPMPGTAPMQAPMAMPQQPTVDPTQNTGFDYTYVSTPAQIAIYDDQLSEPRIVMIDPAPTTEFIGKLAATIYENAQKLGGTIAYSIILQVTENFIHARFTEMVVSIFNGGKTIRFADQGPGFKNKDRALQPGFSSATQPMKQFIKGVGSGLPTVKEWLQMANNGGRLTIEDNLNGGAVVTISMEDTAATPTTAAQPVKKSPVYMPSLNEKERNYLQLLAHEGAMGITEIVELTGISKSTVHTDLGRLEQHGLIENEPGTKRRMLSALGAEVVKALPSN